MSSLAALGPPGPPYYLEAYGDAADFGVARSCHGVDYYPYRCADERVATAQNYFTYPRGC